VPRRGSARAGDGALDRPRGHWRGFQVRYPESNRIHKRMLRASRRLWAQPREDDLAWRESRMHLWRSHCNCPYWHGVFGGLYLPHLRSAIYKELIAAEAGVAGAGVERGDLDLDSYDDALPGARLGRLGAARGGRMWAFDDRRTLWNRRHAGAPARALSRRAAEAEVEAEGKASTTESGQGARQGARRPARHGRATRSAIAGRKESAHTISPRSASSSRPRVLP
jgi:hypothetical protein